MLYDQLFETSEKAYAKESSLKMRLIINLIYFQLIRLDNLFAYWNVKTQLFYLSNYDESLVSKFF